MKKSAFLISFLLFTQIVFTQVAINTDGSSADNSAMLDVQSTTKGILIPRLTTAQRILLSSPATGLLLFDTDENNFYFYNGSKWTLLKSGTINWNFADSKLTTSDPSCYVGIGTADPNAPLTVLGRISQTGTGQSVFLGEGAGFNDDLSDNFNTFVGYQSGYTNTSGYFNLGHGYQTLYSNTTGYKNSANGYKVLFSNTLGYNNTASGFKALFSNTEGYNNTANGLSALYSNSTGYRNTGEGYMALYNNTTGYNNTANGYKALYHNTEGSNNTANGNKALYYNTTGYSNVAIGVMALYKNVSYNNSVAVGDSALFNNGDATTYVTTLSNTAIGSKALFSNTSGNDNTACGFEALYSNTTGILNCAVGNESLYSNITGHSNTAYGDVALKGNTHGDNNTALGYWAFYGGNTYSNSTALGFSASISSSNQVRIGNSSVTTIGGYVNWSNVSDARFKRVVKENVPGLAFIKLLKPVTYQLDLGKLNEYLNFPDSISKGDDFMIESMREKEEMVQTGFLAQDVEKAAQSLGFNFSAVDKPKNENDFYGLRYAEFVVPLVKAVQELAGKNEQFVMKIQDQQRQIDQQKLAISEQSENNKVLQQIVSDINQLKNEIEILKKNN